MAGKYSDLYTHGDETLTIGEWADRRKLNRNTVYARLNQRGWPVEEALGFKKHEDRRDRHAHIFSNRSIPTPVRRAKDGDTIVTRIKNIPYTVCSSDESEMVTSIARTTLREAGVI